MTYNYEWIESLEVLNMIELGELITTAALERTESRGAHYRIDYPAADNSHWLRNLVLTKKGKGIEVNSISIDDSRWRLTRSSSG